MGTQQLMLYILGILAVGIAIIAGIYLFSGHSVSSNKDAIVDDLLSIGQYAYRYRLRPEPLGGGSRRYDGFRLSDVLAKNGNADYSDFTVTSDEITFNAVSTYGYGNIVGRLDKDGQMTFSYQGEFQ